MMGEGEYTVLVVTDSSDALTAVEGLGDRYRVEATRTAADALPVASDGVDALVVGAYLPDRSGEAFLEAVRERGVYARAAVLAPPEDPDFPTFDLRIEASPTTADVRCAVDRLVSLGEYDDRVDRLYELARQQSQRDGPALPVGDGGFDAVDEEILDARAAADSALTDVRSEDRQRLFVGETTREREDDSQ